jgi:hypothetical protein
LIVGSNCPAALHPAAAADFPNRPAKSPVLTLHASVQCFRDARLEFLRVDTDAVDGVTLWTRDAANEQFTQRTEDFQKP